MSRAHDDCEIGAPGVRGPRSVGRKASTALCSLALVLLAFLPRLGFALEGESIPVVRSPTPGMDIDVNWNAARALRSFGPGDPNLELMASSAPLHVGWLALLQTVFGESMLACRIAVAVVSSLRFALLFAVALRVGRSRWGAIAGTALLALMPAWIYFDAVLLKAATDLTLLAGLLCLATRAPARSRWTRLGTGLGLGVLLSACFLSQLNTFLYAPVVAGYLLVRGDMAWRERLALAGPAALLFGIAFVGFQAHSRSAAAGMPHAGVNLLLGFQPGADIGYRPLPDLSSHPHSHAFVARLAAEVESGRPLTPAEADTWYRERAFAAVRADPWRALALMGRRALAVFNDYEIKGGDQLQWLRRHALSLRASPVRYGVLLVLGLLGLASLVSTRRWPEVVLLAGLLLAVTAVTSVTMVLFRLRAPTTLVLGLLAAEGMPFLVRQLRSAWMGRPRALAVPLLAIGLGVWLAARPILEAEKPGLDEQAEVNDRLSREREALELALDEGSTATPAARGRRAVRLAQLYRHGEAFREARAVVHASPESDDANWLYLRYLAWLGRYAEARAFLSGLRAYDEARFQAIGRQTVERFEREALLRFVLNG